MEKKYEPKKYEDIIYQSWENSGYFNPDKLPGKRPKKYIIMMPPPNITNVLHMGHALNNTIQDILIRYHRMKGEKTLWLPGTDHAGIATQNVVERNLLKQNLTRQQLGREKFAEKVWQWKKKYGNIILDQLKKLGVSCDWTRTRFTLDKYYCQAVQTTFIHYYKKGYIYRGPRIVNWCPRCSTAISDIEIKYKKEKSKLWYIKYPFKNNKNKFIIVATTRPETMLGDTAVAVNPKDEKYKKLIGQKLILPIVNREIPIIAHRLVDPKFGTGAVKITPAHDSTDWKIGKDTHLKIINVIGPNAKMTKEAGEYEGLTTLEARKKIIDKLKKLNLLEKEEDYEHEISLCSRCSTPIQPQISTQWFVKMDKLVKPAIEAVKKNKIKIIPERYKKYYLNWLNNIDDWCISRQLWWGHRLPVWFCQNNSEKYIVSTEKPKKCPFCNNCQMKQSDDVLDTWFSSALWPFATLGWPKKTKDLKEYYPTSFLSTAQDIIYLWVARMVFSSLEFIKKIPFHVVYIHPTILASDGRRMSKSFGNGVDPSKLIDTYGADATRFGIIYQITRGQQAVKFDERTTMSSRNFVNKIWNIGRFIEIKKEGEKTEKNIKPKTITDKWILSKLNRLIDSISKKIENYQFGEATRELYEFTWHEFADWYLEISKYQINNKEIKNNTINLLEFIYLNLLKLLHPFIPFVTEKIWQSFNQKNLLIISNWPKVNKKMINTKIEKKFEELKNLVIEIRNWKQEQGIPFKEKTPYDARERNKKLSIQNEQKKLIEDLTNVKLLI